MVYRFINRKHHDFKQWWQAPNTTKDRVMGASVGGIGFFWIGVIGRLFFGTLPAPISTIGLWAFGCAILGIAFGLVFPKLTACLLFPFTTIGVGT